MKIAFVGDSFCAESGEDPTRWDFRDGTEYPAWTTLILKEYNATAIQLGIGGDCLFHSYFTLLDHIDDADLIIFCVTEPNRLANIDMLPMNFAVIEDIDKSGCFDDVSLSKDIKDAALKYYKHLFSYEFHKAAHLGILMQADQLILEKKKKCIWFPGFPNSVPDYKITSGPIGTTPLITFAEENHPLIPHSNHFSKEQNENMFTLIKDIIDKDAFEPKPIDMNII